MSIPEYQFKLSRLILETVWYKCTGSFWDIGFGPEDPRKTEDCGQVHAYVNEHGVFISSALQKQKVCMRPTAAVPGKAGTPILNTWVTKQWTQVNALPRQDLEPAQGSLTINYKIIKSKLPLLSELCKVDDLLRPAGCRLFPQGNSSGMPGLDLFTAVCQA